MARPLVCHGTDKKRLCHGVHQLSSRLNLILKHPLRDQVLYTKSNRLATINVLDSVFAGDSWQNVKHRVAELGFYQFGYALRCFYCSSKSKSIESLTPESDLKITDLHTDNDCSWYITRRKHDNESGNPELECPNCCADVHYLHALLPCGHIICHYCSFQLEVCPWCTFIIAGILRVRSVDNGQRPGGTPVEAPSVPSQV